MNQRKILSIFKINLTKFKNLDYNLFLPYNISNALSFHRLTQAAAVVKKVFLTL